MDDWFFYSGEIRRGSDFDFVKCVSQQQSKSKANHAKIVMCSGGGDPDAAYKMARYLQHKYDSYSVVVSGFCKSAATLFAIGADEIIFTPFGELGPLDIQLQKEDKLFGQESGLNINEAILSLESQARQTFNDMLIEVIRNSGGIVTFKTASEVVTGMVSALYGPIFAQIEPEEVGSRSRAMRIGEQYAERLDSYGNLKPNALRTLSTKYTSHSFVIDFTEAQVLFNKVRLANKDEEAVVDGLGSNCRYPQSAHAVIQPIEVDRTESSKPKETPDVTAKPRKRTRKQPPQTRIRANGEDTSAAK